MGKIISEELKREVVAAHKSGDYTVSQIKEKFGVSSSAIYNWCEAQARPEPKMKKVVAITKSKEIVTDNYFKIDSTTNQVVVLSEDDLIKHAIKLLAAKY